MSLKLYNLGDKTQRENFMKKISYFILTMILLCFIQTPIFAKDNTNYQKNNTDIDTITISFAGDFTLGTYRGQGAGGRFDEIFEQNGANYFLENVKTVFQKDDITFINLEGVFSNEPATANKTYPISCNPNSVYILTNGGIDVVGLANNHTLDCGEKGLSLTKSILEKNNINYCNSDEISIIEKNGIRIAFLSEKGFSEDTTIKEQLLKDIRIAKENKANIIIVMFHWGVERDYYNNAIQQNLAYLCIDNGANIVVGCHPHVIQGIEIYKDCPIVYSMGNFCFGANKNPKDKDSFIFQQTIQKKDNVVTLGVSKVIPCRISSTTTKNDYKPTILEKEEKENVIKRLEQYSSKYEVSYFENKK